VDIPHAKQSQRVQSGAPVAPQPPEAGAATREGAAKGSAAVGPALGASEEGWRVLGPPEAPLDVVARLLGAAGQVTDRSVKVIYLSEARVTLDREVTRHRELGLLLEAAEAEVARTGPRAG
jgi:hypothetical protein